MDADHDGRWEHTAVSANGVTTSKNYDTSGNLLNTSAKQTFTDGSILETITKADGSILKRETDINGNVKETAVDSGAQNLATALSATASFLGLVQAIQSGKPLPIVGAGITDIASTGLQSLQRNEWDLIIGYGRNDTVTISNYFLADHLKPAQFSFADGVNWSPEQLLTAYPLHLTGKGDNISMNNRHAQTLYADGGDDTVYAGDGNTVLHGGGGNDYLAGGIGNDLVDGGEGNDTLAYSGGNNLLIGGRGNDTITTSSGRDILAFNRGDGQDNVNLIKGQDKTLSLGGIRYADLQLKKSGMDLTLLTGNNEQITFKNWYESWYPTTASHNLSTLQVVIEGTADYNAASTDKTRNKKVEQFDFNKVVEEFETARKATPALTSWRITDALLKFHLQASDTAAIGGDLAYGYARNGNVSDATAQLLLATPEFGGQQSLSSKKVA